MITEDSYYFVFHKLVDFLVAMFFLDTSFLQTWGREAQKQWFIKRSKRCWTYSQGLNGLPKSNVLKYLLEDNCSIVVRPSGTEPKLKAYISVSAEDKVQVENEEKKIKEQFEQIIQ